MYNGTGLQTARGSGSNGYTQRNKFFVKPNMTKTVSSGDLTRVSRKPNEDIVEHERKRQIELKLVAVEDKLVDQGYSDDEIVAKLNEARRVLEANDCEFSSGECDTTTSSYAGVWSKHQDDVSYNQLQKNIGIRSLCAQKFPSHDCVSNFMELLEFWSELPLHARHQLLKIDKQTLFEQTRKNMYCSRCNGLLLESFMQIITYGKSLQQDGTSSQGTGCNIDVQDPSLHPWGGLTTTKDGTITLLERYICSNNLNGLQSVFDSARERERERKLLYPNACRMVGYGRGHWPRKTCALHIARLSVDTLVDFWSALGEATRYSLLRMKEEDFIERLMHRFDNKKFCKDCRKNVIREFKELKELKRVRRETRCTSWFCVADTSFQCEVTHDTIQADWHKNYGDSETYKHYEWAVGTEEGKYDILDFENVGTNLRVKVNGVDLRDFNSCYITLRAWRTDGRCNEISVKAHALKGQHCVHGRLVVGDGFVTITRGESIRRFFERAEEVEKEEDDDSMDMVGNELDGGCTRPQKHAKTPELAREFLLDAATVIFKEQVEKAFREGTARQNAHSMFVSLASKLLEERVLVACKDIITLEKQCKLLEEEEKEKRDEEERKERRRVKEKEKKLRRKERLSVKEKELDGNCGQLTQTSTVPDIKEESTCVNDERDVNDHISDYDKSSDGENAHRKDKNQLFVNDQLTHDRPSKLFDRQQFESGPMVNKPDQWFQNNGFESSSKKGNSNGVNKPVRRLNGSRYNERLHSSGDYRPKTKTIAGYNESGYTKQVWEPKTNFDSDAAGVVKPFKLISLQNGKRAMQTSNEDNDLKGLKTSPHNEPEPECGTTDLSPSFSNSSSDSCLSCLSEAGGNTSFSSNTLNSGSSSTSDSEYTSQHSEAKSVKDCYEKPPKSFSAGSEKQNANTDQMKKGKSVFSLFHFGGPVDVSNRFKTDAAAGPLKEDTDVNVCSKTPTWGDSCGVEEYKLFAANTGIQFSFF